MSVKLLSDFVKISYEMDTRFPVVVCTSPWILHLIKNSRVLDKYILAVIGLMGDLHFSHLNAYYNKK